MESAAAAAGAAGAAQAGHHKADHRMRGEGCEHLRNISGRATSSSILR
jgi:hypothetical protein